MNLRRAARLSVTNGVVAGYIHNALTPGLGKIGVLVALESTADAAKLLDLGRQIAMHVAAARPDALTVEEVDSSALDRERAVLRALSGPLSESDIAREFYLSHSTIHSHTKSIYRKLGVSSRAQAVRHARDLGLL